MLCWWGYLLQAIKQPDKTDPLGMASLIDIVLFINKKFSLTGKK